MNINRKLIFDAAKRRGAVFRTMDDVRDMDAAIDAAVARLSPAPPPAVPAAPAAPRVSHLSLTPKVAMEIVGHEAIVPEWYRDSVGVGTWAIGITNRSGHNVDRYKDNPQTIEHCLEVFLWLLREKYIPGVVAAFQGFILTEAQFAAALSFHYNTGAIGRASWVAAVKEGDLARGRRTFMDWRKPAAIIGRREKERDLFFDGKWSQDGKATVYRVRKPSYTPDWGSAKRIDITEPLTRLLRS